MLILINGLVPGAILLVDALRGALGADPVNFAILTTGMLTLVFLTLTLLVTPLRRFTGFQWLFHFRRSLGLYAFFYGCCHFLIFFVFDRQMSISSTVSEMFKRTYLIYGSAALMLMAPLAATSFNTLIRKMGARRWNRLHMLIYPVAILGILHYLNEGKVATRLPKGFAVVICGLLAFRLVVWAEKKWGTPATAAAAPSSARRWNGRLHIQKIIQETPDVRTFRFATSQGAPFPFSHHAGQHLTIHLSIAGKTVRRTYTIASAPNARQYCEITVKCDDQGAASRFLHEHLREGDAVEISAPAGSFTFHSSAQIPAVALIAGGVGITPLMAIIRDLTHRRWPGQIHLLYSNKTEPDIIFRSELDALAKDFANLHITHTLTRAPASGWTGRTGRINEALLKSAIPNLAQTPVYICGPADMIAATRSLLQALHVPGALIHVESFGIAKNLPLPHASATAAPVFGATFLRSNLQAAAPADQPLLEVAESLAIPWDSECRAGICGRCKCRLISGSVEMPTQEALTDADRSANLILLCQARPLEDVTLDA